MKKKQNPDEALSEIETYYAPPPPKNGCIIGVDCHPDTFTAVETKGSNPYDLKTGGFKKQFGMNPSEYRIQQTAVRG